MHSTQHLLVSNTYWRLVGAVFALNTNGRELRNPQRPAIESRMASHRSRAPRASSRDPGRLQGASTCAHSGVRHLCEERSQLASLPPGRAPFILLLRPPAFTNKVT